MSWKGKRQTKAEQIWSLPSVDQLGGKSLFVGTFISSTSITSARQRPQKPRALAVNTTAAITTRSFIQTKCNIRIYALKQFSGIGRGFQQGGWEGGADTGQVGLKLLSMFKMFKMFIIVKIANLRHTVASNAVLWKHPWLLKWSCSKNLMADSAHDKDS